MIILEGPDGAGKTVLSVKLQNEFGLELQPKVVSGEAKSLVSLDDWVDEELNKGVGPRLYDRFPLTSAPHYLHLPNPTFDGRFKDPAWLMGAWIQLRHIKPLVIVCLPPLRNVVDSVWHDDTNAVVRQSIEPIYWSYFNWANGFRPLVDIITYDYTRVGVPAEHQWGNIERHVRWIKARCREADND